VVFSLAQQDLPEDFDDFSDIDALWATGVACETGGADPDGFGFQKLILETELSVPDDLIGEDVHLGDGRAASRALAALITGEEVLAA